MHSAQRKSHRTRGQVPRRCPARRGRDANGNLTSDGQHHFIYDAANRLHQVDIVQGEQASNVTYLHNALGQRVFKSERQEAQFDASETPPGISLIDLFIRFFYWLFNIAPADAILGQSYLYDDATLGDSPSLLGEYSNGGSLSQGNAEYIWLPTESGQAQLIGLYKEGRFYAVHTDHLGTPRLITNDANQVVWQWAYSAFGDNPPSGILQATQNPDSSASPAVLLQATAPQLTMNLRMAGQYFDEESGLFENGFRSYRPGMGAYSQADPIGLEGGWNRTGYVGGNPLNGIDPRGLRTCVLVTRNGVGFGNHAALYIERVRQNENSRTSSPFIYDPSGSYARRSNFAYNENASIDKFADYHQKKFGDSTEQSCKDTSLEEEQRLYERAISEGPQGGPVCALSISDVLGGSTSFPGVQPGTWWPGNLIRDSKK